MSTLRTREPSFARRAAKGRPTTSELKRIKDISLKLQMIGTHRLMMVMTLPLALSPYSSNPLYTPRCSSTLTTANGVHGRTDLTVPSGASSWRPFVLVAEGMGVWGGVGGRREIGEMKRMLRRKASTLPWSGLIGQVGLVIEVE